MGQIDKTSTDGLDPQASLYEGTLYGGDANETMLHWFRDEDRRVLDVGCGSGAHAATLRARGMEVHGVTLSHQEQKRAASQMERAVLANVETWQPDYQDGFFDALLLSHVLEHLVDPGGTLQKLSRILRPGGRVYVALPNIAHWRYRLESVLGRFRYEDMGPMDKRHLRFFTYERAQELVEEAGLALMRVEVSGHFPLGALRRGLPRLARKLDRFCTRHWPNLFGTEVRMVATKPSRLA